MCRVLRDAIATDRDTQVEREDEEEEEEEDNEGPHFSLSLAAA